MPVFAILIDVERDPETVRLVAWARVWPLLGRMLIGTMLFWSVAAVVGGETGALWVTLPMMLFGLALTSHYSRPNRQQPRTGKHANDGH